MTPGIDIRDWPVSNSDVQAIFWDFGGQVMAHATHQFFLRSHCVYVLLLNARTDINANQQAEYWLEHIRAFGEDAPVLLVGNKSDLTQVNLDLHRLRETYPNIRGFFPLSCTKGSGVAEFREALAAHLQEAGMHQVQFATPHFSVMEELRIRSRDNPFLSKAEFERLCARLGVAEHTPLNRKWLLDILDKLGVIIHFPDIDWLDEFILNPRWLTYGVYQLLYSERAQAQKGRLTEGEVAEILSGRQVTDNEGHVLSYPKERVRLIVDAMRQFKLCYRLPGDDRTLILPDLLPSDRPQDLAFNREEAMRFDFDFEGFLPRHLMTMFTVQRHPEIVDGLVWQNGVRLTSGAFHDTQALAEADYFNRRFSLWVSGKQAGRYFAVLHDEVLQIVRRMEKLRYTEWLWLPEAARIEAGQVSPEWQPRAKYRDMIAIEGRGGREFICEGGVYDLARVFGNIPKEARPSTGTTIHINQAGSVSVSGRDTNNFSGDFKSAILNVGATLREVTQTIQVLPTPSESQKRDLERLVAELTAALEQLPAGQEQQAEKIAKRVKQLMEEAASPEPDSDMLKVTAEGLKKAAEAVGSVAPAVWTATKEILKIVAEPFA